MSTSEPRRLRLAACAFILLSTGAGLWAVSEPRGVRTPHDALTQFVIADDCQIELIAAEPDCIDPVAMQFAPDGALWIVEYSDYPNGPSQSQPGLSRIRVLTDSNSDGRYDNARIFADKLLFANGLMLWKDGAIVTTNGKIVFLKDTNADGRADKEEIWFQGFATANPQLRANHPTLGIDNNIYVANGLMGGNITPGPTNPWKLSPDAPPVSLSGRDFRFDPFTGACEAISGMSQFGLSFDDAGNRFVCENRHPCRHVVLTDDDLKRAPSLRLPTLFHNALAADNESRLFPISRAWTTSNLHANQFTAACGVTIYRGNALPEKYLGNCFVCDPTGNLVHREAITPRGASFSSTTKPAGVEFLATKDEWFRPVNLAHGPDGALYICDMVRAVIEHPEYMPYELQKRPDLLLGNDKGRIWRIVSKNAPPAERGAFTIDTSEESLVALLDHTNVWQRETAHRLLLERHQPSLAKALQQRLLDPKHGFGAARALWLLDSLSLLTEAELTEGLQRLDTRIHALRLMRLRFPNDEKLNALALKQFQPGMDDALLSAFLRNTSWTDADAALRLRREAIAKLSEHRSDPFYRAMIAVHAGDRVFDLALAVYQAQRKEYPGPETPPGPGAVCYFCELLGRGAAPGDIQKFLDAAFNGEPSAAFRDESAALSGLLAGMPKGATALTALIESAPAETRGKVQACLAHLQSIAAGDAAAVRERASDLPLLALSKDAGAVSLLSRLASQPDTDLAAAAVDVLRSMESESAGTALIQLLDGRSPRLRRLVIAALVASPGRVPPLLDAIEDRRISPLEIDAATKALLARHSDDAIRTRAAALLKSEPPEERRAVLADYQAALKLSSDPRRGKLVFEKNCATCHKIDNVGVEVAPDISDSRGKTPDYLMTNILDPNRAIDNAAISYTLVANDGRVFTGLIASETSALVTLKLPEGKTVTIAREEIEQLANNGVSLMPVGLEKAIDHQQMADLISFIRNWRYLDGSVPQSVIK